MAKASFEKYGKRKTYVRKGAFEAVPDVTGFPIFGTP
jgi:hypothetical protein